MTYKGSAVKLVLALNLSTTNSWPLLDTAPNVLVSPVGGVGFRPVELALATKERYPKGKEQFLCSLALLVTIAFSIAVSGMPVSIAFSNSLLCIF
jgi:hypothetical protein